MIVKLLKKYLPEVLYKKIRSWTLGAIRVFRAFFGVRNGIYSLQGIKIDMTHQLMTQNIKNAVFSGRYENQESALIKKFVNSCDVVLELGTGIGYVTMTASRITGPERVHSFEANPDLEPLIRRNFSLNNIMPNLSISLLGRGFGEAEFYVSNDFWASSLIEERGGKIVNVPMRDLNETIKETKATVLICDIEGGEVDIVDYLNPQSIRVVIIECHPNIVGAVKINEMMERLSALGFSQAHRSYEFEGAPLFQYVATRSALPSAEMTK